MKNGLIGATDFCFSSTFGLSGDSIFGDFASVLMVFGDFFSVLTGLGDFLSALIELGDFFSVFTVAFGVFFCFSDDFVVLAEAFAFAVGVFFGDGLFSGDDFSSLITSRFTDFSRFFGGDLLNFENFGQCEQFVFEIVEFLVE